MGPALTSDERPRRTDALPLVLAAGAALALGPGPGGFWDSFDYLRQMATGDMTGALLLGRAGFVLAGRGVWALGSVWGPDAAAWFVAVSVLACTVAATRAMQAWIAALGGGDGRTGALLWALSPAVATLGFAVMSEIPAMALVLSGLALSARAWRSDSAWRAAAGAALVALSLSARETAVVWVVPLVLVPVLSPRVPRRLAVHAALGVIVGVAATLAVTGLTFPELLPTLARWRAHMADEATRYPTAWGAQLRTWGLWVLASAPVAGPLAVIAVVRRRPSWSDPAGILAAWGVLILCSLALYQDLAWGPRFLVPALPGVCLLGDRALRGAGPRARIAVAVALAATVAAAFPATAPLRDLASRGRRAAQTLRSAPPDSVIIAGWLCPAMRYRQAVDPREPARTLICPGWVWPGEELADVVRAHLGAGRSVLAATDPALWPGARFERSLRDVLTLGERGLALVAAGDGLARVRDAAKRSPPD